MKTKNYVFLFIILLMVNACKKHAGDSVTGYQTISAYDTSGRPYNLLKDSISPSLLSFIDSTLPNGKDLRISHPEFFTSNSIADIAITQTSDVYTTFVSGNSGFSNSIAFYIYPTILPPTKATDIKLFTYVFPHTGGSFPPLYPGDKMKIGRFDAGTSIGFVLLKDAWNLSTHTIDNGTEHFFTTGALNPELDPKLKKHVVLINYTPENKVLYCFKDTNRSSPECDNDFNDVVMYCTVTP